MSHVILKREIQDMHAGIIRKQNKTNKKTMLIARINGGKKKKKPEEFKLRKEV